MTFNENTIYIVICDLRVFHNAVSTVDSV